MALSWGTDRQHGKALYIEPNPDLPRDRPSRELKPRLALAEESPSKPGICEIGLRGWRRGRYDLRNQLTVRATDIVCRSGGRSGDPSSRHRSGRRPPGGRDHTVRHRGPTLSLEKELRCMGLCDPRHRPPRPLHGCGQSRCTGPNMTGTTAWPFILVLSQEGLLKGRKRFRQQRVRTCSLGMTSLSSTQRMGWAGKDSPTASTVSAPPRSVIETVDAVYSADPEGHSDFKHGEFSARVCDAI